MSALQKASHACVWITLTQAKLSQISQVWSLSVLNIVEFRLGQKRSMGLNFHRENFLNLLLRLLLNLHRQSFSR